MKIPVISSIVYYSKVFYRYAGKNLYLLGLAILLGGSLEGFGLSLLLPLLDIQQLDAGAGNAYSKCISQFLKSLGLPVSMISILAMIVIAFSLKGIFLFLQITLKARIMTSLTKAQRLILCQKYAQMSYPYYINSKIGHLNNVVTTEVVNAVASFGNYLDVLVAAIYIIIYALAAAVLNWQMTVLVFVTCGFIFYFLRRLSSLARELSVKISGKNSQIQSLLIPMIYNFKYLKATSSFGPFYKQLSSQVEDYRALHFRHGVLSAVSGAIVEPFAILFLSALILYHVSFRGQAMSEIFVLLVFFYKAFSRTVGFQVVWQKFNSWVGGVETVEKMNHDLERHREKSGPQQLTAFTKSIILQNVSFSYNTRPVLENISITIPKNKTIGIVGESGAGKTTLFDMITGLLAPQQGKVSIDGIPYDELDLTSLRSLIGYVIQEPVVFDDTAANNISFWQGSYEHDPACRLRVEDAAARAHCLEFIQKTEHGFATVLGDKGIKLSVGQRQRIAIARELFKQPQIIIFDEATSALDTESEQLIQQSIKEMAGKLTMVIVAHRLSTIRYCDFIYVLSQGRIVERGSFRELYNSESSRFRQMCNLQNV